MANYARFQLRGDTKANWLSVNPILAKNEPAIETDTKRFKIGDGVSTYSQLSYGRNTVEYSSLYNVTSLFPLPSGYYSHESAVLAIPGGERSIGLIITYETASGVWYTERFIGTDVANWVTLSNWEKLPDAGDLAQLRSDLSEIEINKLDKSSLSSLLDLDSENNAATSRAIKLLNDKVEQVKDGGLDDGSIEFPKLSPTLAAYIGSGGEVTNQADDDDLENTVINSVPVIREKTTKTYNPETYSGMGRVILRKNMVNGVNILTQEMINQANTIYEIRYDFDLTGTEITIPEGCVLDFQGGSLSNGILIGNNSFIKTDKSKILLNILLSGSWENEIFWMNWFENTNYSNVINSIIESTPKKCKIIFEQEKEYILNLPIIINNEGKGNITIDFNNCIIEDNIQQFYPGLYNSCICVLNTKNITIKNLIYRQTEERIDYNGSDVPYYPSAIRVGDSVNSVENVLIENIRVAYVSNHNTTIIDFIGNTYNCIVSNIICENVDLTQGVNCEYGFLDGVLKYPHNISIENIVGKNLPYCRGLLRASCAYNIYFKNCFGFNIQRFIDVWSGDRGSNGIYESVIFENCKYQVSSEFINGTGVYIDNNRRTEGRSNINYPFNFIFNNCTFECINGIYSKDYYALRIYSTEAPILFNNCSVHNFGQIARIAPYLGADVENLSDNKIKFSHCQFTNGFFSIIKLNHINFDSCIFLGETPISTGTTKYPVLSLSGATVILQNSFINISAKCVLENSANITDYSFIGNTIFENVDTPAYLLSSTIVEHNNQYKGAKLYYNSNNIYIKKLGLSHGSAFPTMPNNDNVGFMHFNNIPYFWNGSDWKEADGNPKGIIRYGNTSQRPSSAIGAQSIFEYFDSDLMKAIWGVSNGATFYWYNFDGSRAEAKLRGTWAKRPLSASYIYDGFAYFCTDKQSPEQAAENPNAYGIVIYARISNSTITWQDALGRNIS